MSFFNHQGLLWNYSLWTWSQIPICILPPLPNFTDTNVICTRSSCYVKLLTRTNDSCKVCQSCISKGIWRQGKGSVVRNFYVSTLMPCRHMPVLMRFWVSVEHLDPWMQIWETDNYHVMWWLFVVVQSGDCFSICAHSNTITWWETWLPTMTSHDISSFPKIWWNDTA